MRFFSEILLMGGALYLFFLGFLFLFGERLVFHPPRPPYSSEDLEFSLLPTPSGEKVAAVFLPEPDAPAALIYSHGNAEDLAALLPRLERIASLGVSVLAYDYPGYGASTGKPTESGVYEAAEAAMTFLQKQGYPPSRIFLMGFSLGSAPTIFLAHRHAVAGIILQGAFLSAYRTVTLFPIFPGDRFVNEDRIASIVCPALFIHGTDDRVVPFWHGRSLYDRYRGPKEGLWIEGGGHNGLWGHAPTQLSDALEAFFTRTLPQGTAPLRRRKEEGRLAIKKKKRVRQRVSKA